MPFVRSLLRSASAAAMGLTLTAAAAPAPIANIASIAHVLAPEAASVAPARVVPGTSYAFLGTAGGQPIRWNPCAVIHWRANVSQGPRGGLAVLQGAVATVAAATGTQWRYDGPTRAVPRLSVLQTHNTKAQTVVLGWTDRGHSDLLAGRTATTAGMTRTLWFTSTSHRRVSFLTRTHTAAVTRGGVVAFNRASRLPLYGAISWRTVALHELGHVAGLAHSRSSDQVMAPMLSRSINRLQPGDRAGLVRLGRPAGCVSFP